MTRLFTSPSLPPISSVHADGPKKAVTSEEEAAATEVTCEGVVPGRQPATHTPQQQWLQVKQCMEQLYSVHRGFLLHILKK